MDVDSELAWADDAVAPEASELLPAESELLADEPTSMDAALDTPLGSGGDLASRISTTKVYILADMTAPRASKRKAGDDNDEQGPVADELTESETPSDPDVRANALLIHGPPVSELPTARLFAYATQLGAEPLGLEWISDDTCVLVFASAGAAQAALGKLRREPAPDDGWWAARGVPTSVWPAQARITQAAGGAAAERLRAPLALRWARADDVKARGAKGASAFYRKHGAGAGKEVWNPDTGRSEAPPTPAKRRRGADTPDGRRAHDRTDGDDDQRRRLDAEMDAFLEGREASDAAPPHDADGAPDRARFDKTSERVYPQDERGAGREARQARPGGRRGARDSPREGGRGRDRAEGGASGGGGSSGRRRGEHQAGRTRAERLQPKTAEELDAELEAFLGTR